MHDESSLLYICHLIIISHMSIQSIKNAYVNTVNQKCIYGTALFQITSSMDDQSSPWLMSLRHSVSVNRSSSRVYQYYKSKMYTWYSALSNYSIHGWSVFATLYLSFDIVSGILIQHIKNVYMIQRLFKLHHPFRWCNSKGRCIIS